MFNHLRGNYHSKLAVTKWDSIVEVCLPDLDTAWPEILCHKVNSLHIERFLQQTLREGAVAGADVEKGTWGSDRRHSTTRSCIWVFSWMTKSVSNVHPRPRQ